MAATSAARMVQRKKPLQRGSLRSGRPRGTLPPPRERRPAFKADFRGRGSRPSLQRWSRANVSPIEPSRAGHPVAVSFVRGGLFSSRLPRRLSFEPCPRLPCPVSRSCFHQPRRSCLRRRRHLSPPFCAPSFPLSDLFPADWLNRARDDGSAQ